MFRLRCSPLYLALVTSSLLAVILISSPVLGESADRDDLRDPKDMIQCDMTFELEGWSAIYKTAKGKGVILCDNGQRAAVELKVKGAGLTFGKSRILQGTGSFNDVFDIFETFGSYAALQASAGAVRSSEAVAMTKGKVSLAIRGTGQGWDLGVSATRFKIKMLSVDETR